jgi:hypothetical protein
MERFDYRRRLTSVGVTLERASANKQVPHLFPIITRIIPELM